MSRHLNTVISIIVLISLSPRLHAAEQADLTGTWSKWEPKTAIGTGQVDTILKVSGKPGSLLVDYTWGYRSRVKTSKGKVVMRTTTVSYSELPITYKDGAYQFEIPESGRSLIRTYAEGKTIRLTLEEKNGKQSLREVGEKESQPFIKQVETQMLTPTQLHPQK